MGTGYTRNDASNNIADGNVINASDLDGEFDAVVATFNSSSGHTHDGTSAEGAPVTVVGPVQDLVVSATQVKPKTTNTLDLGTASLLYKDAYLQGNMYFRDTNLKIVSSADGQLDIDADTEVEITAPTLDIDASTAVTIDTTTLTITGSANVAGDLDVDNININGNTIISTDTNGNIALTPNGTGEVDISKVDIDSGAIDGVTLGTNSAITQAVIDSVNINGATIGHTDDTDLITLASGVVTVAGELDAVSLDISGDIDVEGTTNLDVVDIDGAVNMATTLLVTGNVDFNGDLDVDGTTNLDVVDIDGAVDMASTLNVTGATTLGASTNVVTPFNIRNTIQSFNGGLSTEANTALINFGLNEGSGNRFGGSYTQASQGGMLNFDVRAGQPLFQIYVREAGTASASGTPALNILSSGNVGIGTSSPDAPLEIEGNVSSTTQFSGFGGLRIHNANGSAHGVTSEMYFTAGTGSSNRGTAIGSQFTSASSGNDLYFATNGGNVSSTNTLSERLRITSAGNVGIGTSSPHTKTVIALAPTASATTVNETADFADQFVLGSADGSATGDRIPLVFNMGSATDNNISAAIVGERGGSGWDTALSFWVNNQTSGSQGTDAIQEAMRIDSSGNVGIGTSSPGELLNLYKASGDVAFRIQSSAGNCYVVNRAASTGMDLLNAMNGPMTFGTNNITRMTIDATGAVTMPAQPAFMARPTSEQANIANGTTIACVEVFDQNADFASSTFNAPVAGRYQLNATVRIDSIDTAATYTRVILLTSNRNYDSIFDVDGAASDPTYWTFVVATLADMDAGDTAYLQFSQNGGTTQADINANEVAFSGYLVA